MSGTIAAIAGGTALIGDAFKYFKGKSQIDQANQIAKNNPFTPESMPYQVKLATQLAAQNYRNGMPGMSQAQNAINRNAGNAYATANKGASSGGDLLDAANKIQVNSNDASQQLALQAASYKSNALGGYEAALGNEGQWQDKLYQNNQLQPYLRAANTSAALTGAGNVNEFGAIDSALTTVQATGQNIANKNYLKQLNQTNTGAMDTSQLIPYSNFLYGP